MIDHLDNLIRKLVLDKVPGFQSETQVRFQPPDDDWRAAVANLTVNGTPANALNVYLVDLRENRKLRSNEWEERVQNGISWREPAPTRIDCHYVISAWSPAAVTQAVEPTVDEHLILYQVLAALVNTAPLNPSRIYPPGSAALAAVPELIRTADLPTAVAPSEGFPKLAELWGAMGANDRWKPVVYLVVTLPLALVSRMSGPLVTTRILEFRQSGSPDTAEVLIEIGGSVLRAGQSVPGAGVRLESTTGALVAMAETDDLGRFTFEGIRAQRYRIRARGSDGGEAMRDVDVPSPTGEYDVSLP